MYDGKKIIFGLIIFVALVTIPFWVNAGKAVPNPDPVISAKAKLAGKCVLPKETMRTSHMQILNVWRTEVVRDKNRVYTAPDGKHFDMSLQNTCMDCHANKSTFCDSCHNYADVNPYCWDCHLQPQEVKYGR